MPLCRFHYIVKLNSTTKLYFMNFYQHYKMLFFVRRQGFWVQWQLKLRESLAHLVVLIMRRVVCDASGAFRVSFV